MTPPDASKPGSNASAGMQSAVSVCAPALSVIKKRADFLKAARAKKWVTKSFILQARERAPDEACADIRIGYTCSKKVGNAVARNAAKRRLREIARLILPEAGQSGWDYVLIGRAEVTAHRAFTDLQDDLRWALRKIHAA